VRVRRCSDRHCACVSTLVEHRSLLQLMLQGHKISGECQRCPIYACIPVSNMTSMRAVIPIGLSPTGTYCATGSGDWQARICKSVPIHPRIDPQSDSCLPAFPLCYVGSLMWTYRELHWCASARTLVYGRTGCMINAQKNWYTTQAAVVTGVCALAFYLECDIRMCRLKWALSSRLSRVDRVMGTQDTGTSCDGRIRTS
jgi:hypothetical protein